MRKGFLGQMKKDKENHNSNLKQIAAEANVNKN